MAMKLNRNATKKLKSTLALVAFMAVLAVSVFSTSFGTVSYIAEHNGHLDTPMATDSIGTVTIDSISFGSVSTTAGLIDGPLFSGR